MPVYSLSSNITDSEFNPELQDLTKSRLNKLFLNDTMGVRDEDFTLSALQDSKFNPLYDILFQNFGFKLKVQTGLFGRQSEEQLQKFQDYYCKLSHERRSTLEMASSLFKSSGLAVLMLNDLVSPKEALSLSRMEERYQSQRYGEIEEFHVFDEDRKSVV